MAFDEVQLDPKISYGATGGPKWRTIVVTSDSGYEQRIQPQLNARLSWNISSGVKSQAQMAALIVFFRARQGKTRGFRFKDWTDYKALNEKFWTGFGSGTMRLLKTYSDAGHSEVRLIKKPVTGTVTIDGHDPSFYSLTIDYTTGIITGADDTFKESDHHWSGEFDVPVRFDTDEMTLNLADFSSRNWDSIPVIELFLP